MKSAASLIPEKTHVVILVNFVAPNMVAVFQDVAKRVRKLTVMSSVAMESNRDWQTEWGDLDVRVQKTWTITRHPKHPGGFSEVNYVHIPLDTLGQLRSLRPDAIVSLELGARTVWSSIYRRLNRGCVHITAVNASQRTESGRGSMRVWLRNRILRGTDWVTYNGPSCREVLLDLGVDPEKMSLWSYAADPRKPYLGPLKDRHDRTSLRLLTVGQLSERKGVLIAQQQLCDWAASHPERTLQWNVVGNGPLADTMKSASLPHNLEVTFHGHLGPESVARQYRDNDLLLFPTLADEWGLVVDESLLSGLPVIGSCYSQAVTTIVRDGINGMFYDPEQTGSLAAKLDQLLAMTDDDYQRMPELARETGAARSPQVAADQLTHAIRMAANRS